MDKNFNERYIEASIVVPELEILENRWLSVTEYAENANKHDIINLLLYYFGFDAADEFLENFCDSIKEHDTSFSKNNLQEIRMLCGVTLLEIAKQENSYAYLIELIIRAAVFSNDRAMSSSITKEIIDFLDCDSNNIRNVQFDISKLAKNIPNENLLDKLAQEVWDETTSKEMGSYIKNTQSVISNMHTIFFHLNQVQALRYEESQLLWWLTTGYSTSISRPYKSIDKQEGCFRIGYEISQFISEYPGPVSANALIHKMLEQCKGAKKKLAFGEFIQLAPDDISENIIDSNKSFPLLSLLPVSSALNHAKDTEQVIEWSSKFSKTIKIEGLSEKFFSHEVIAEQIYYETLALKCFNSMSE